MAVLRDRPYVQFNFLVDLGTGNTDGPEAGFQEISNIGMEVTVSEYRNGNSKENSVRKITGLNKATDVTMKRGVIGSLNLYQWLNDIRNGNQNAERTVTIQLQNEDHTAVVQTWKLLRARIIKHVSGPVNAKGTDVAMEELTLAYERLEMESVNECARAEKIARVSVRDSGATIARGSASHGHRRVCRVRCFRTIANTRGRRVGTAVHGNLR